MTQTRLNNIIMTLHSLTDEPYLIDTGNEFVHESSHREGLFGKFVILVYLIILLHNNLL